MTIKEALEVVIAKSNNPYAIEYAIAGLSLGGSSEGVVEERGNMVAISHKPTGKIMVGRELKVQLLYVLNNLGSWRGEEARAVKEVLKAYAK